MNRNERLTANLMMKVLPGKRACRNGRNDTEAESDPPDGRRDAHDYFVATCRARYSAANFT